MPLTPTNPTPIINSSPSMFEPDIDGPIERPTAEQIKADIKAAIRVLAQVSPSNLEVAKHNKKILDYLCGSDTLQILLHILIESENDDIAAKLTINFISAYLRKQTQPGVAVIRHDKKAIYKKVREIFFCSSVSHKNKHLLETSFTRFLATLNAEFISIRTDLCECIVSFFNQEVSTQNLKDCFYLIRAVMSDSLETKNLRYLEQSLLMNFIRLSNELVKKLKEDLSAAQLGAHLPAQIQWTEQVLSVTELLYEKATPDKLAVLKEQIYRSTEFANLCHNSLSLCLHNKFSLIIPSAGDNDLERLNLIKISTLNMIKGTLKVIMKSRNALGTPVFISTMTIMELCLDEILPSVISEVREYPQSPVANEQVLAKFLEVLADIIHIPHLFPKILKLRDLVCYQLVFPCMLNTPKDAELNYEDFCRMKTSIAETADDKMFHNVHEAAGMVCEALADRIDGTVTLMIEALINLIDFQLTADPKYFENLPSLLVNSFYYENYNYFQLIDASLTIITVLSYYGDSRMDLCEKFEALIVRRQEFFSRIDIPCDLLVSFILANCFYLSNFFELILQGKASAPFHRALVNHMLELMLASYDQTTHDLFSDEKGKVGYMARDYIQNVVSQKLMVAALYPDFSEESEANMSNFFKKVSFFLGSDFAPKILEDVILEFVKLQVCSNWQDRYANVSSNVKGPLAVCLTETMFHFYHQPLHHESICKVKMFEILKLILHYTSVPDQLIAIAFSSLESVLNTEFSYLDDVIQVLQVFLRRVYKEKLTFHPDQQKILGKCIINGIRVSDNETFQTVLFDLILHANLLGLFSDQIVQALLVIFQDNRAERQIDQEAEVAMEKSLYLILQVSFCNFAKVSSNTWLAVVTEMIDFIKENYVRQDTITIGKCVAICLCCYSEDPVGFEEFLGTRLEGLWDCIIEDELKYATKTEKKIVSLKLLKLFSSVPARPVVINKVIPILKCVTTLIYYLYQKQEVAWHDVSSEQEMDEKSEDEDKNEPWMVPFATMGNNDFYSELPDECVLMRDVCQKVNTGNPAGFLKFVNDLPIGLQNLLKDKLYNYKEGYKNENTKKLRRIVKVRQPSPEK